jgi:hypothetical protein
VVHRAVVLGDVSLPSATSNHVDLALSATIVADALERAKTIFR